MNRTYRKSRLIFLESLLNFLLKKRYFLLALPAWVHSMNLHSLEPLAPLPAARGTETVKILKNFPFLL